MAEVCEEDVQEKEEKEEEEYVLLELDDCLYSDIPPGRKFQDMSPQRCRANTPDLLNVYIMNCASLGVANDEGLDTLTPTLILGDGLKMTGEYEETVGTCYLFSENAAPPKPIHDKTPLPGEGEDEQAKSRQEAASKEVKHLASVNKILKFRTIHVDQPQHRGYQHNDREI